MEANLKKSLSKIIIRKVCNAWNAELFRCLP